MMEFNLLKIGFTLMTLFIVVIGGLINNFEKSLPAFFAQTFRYGKYAYKGKPSSLLILEVPKRYVISRNGTEQILMDFQKRCFLTISRFVPFIAMPYYYSNAMLGSFGRRILKWSLGALGTTRWFKHFYLFAAAVSTLSVALGTYVYIFGGDNPQFLRSGLDIFGTSYRRAGVSGLSAFLALVLLAIQCWRRFYETFFISVFSDSKMNIAHYAVGYIHYFGAITAILVEAPGFTPLSIEHRSVISWSDLRWADIVGTVLFLWAWLHQFRAANILASLRKNNKGEVVNTKHNVPSGDWFELVSAPHLLCETLMYAALSIILFGNYTFLFVFFWVLSNQMETALLTHWWYLSHFKDYPKERHAFIPFLL